MAARRGGPGGRAGPGSSSARGCLVGVSRNEHPCYGCRRCSETPGHRRTARGGAHGSARDGARPGSSAGGACTGGARARECSGCAVTEPVVHPLTVRLHEFGERTARPVLALLVGLAAAAPQLSQVPELAAVLVKLGADQAAALAVSEMVQDMAAAGVPPGRLPSVSGVTAHTSLANAE